MCGGESPAVRVCGRASAWLGGGAEESTFQGHRWEWGQQVDHSLALWLWAHYFFKPQFFSEEKQYLSDY